MKLEKKFGLQHGARPVVGCFARDVLLCIHICKMSQTTSYEGMCCFYKIIVFNFSNQKQSDVQVAGLCNNSCIDPAIKFPFNGRSSQSNNYICKGEIDVLILYWVRLYLQTAVITVTIRREWNRFAIGVIIIANNYYTNQNETAGNQMLHINI
jgi:hypothetical protein